MNKDWHLEWKLEQHRRFKTPLDKLYVKLLEDFEVEVWTQGAQQQLQRPGGRGQKWRKPTVEEVMDGCWKCGINGHQSLQCPVLPERTHKFTKRRCAECNAYHVRRDGEDCPVLKWLRCNGYIVQNDDHA